MKDLRAKGCIAGMPLQLAPAHHWRCICCDKLLGVHRDGRMHIRVSRRRDYAVGYPVAAHCHGCGAMNCVHEPDCSVEAAPETELPSEDDPMRIPRLFRRWELTEIFQPNRSYRIEDAGRHADGTPLLAIYTDSAETVALAVVPLRSGPNGSG